MSFTNKPFRSRNSGSKSSSKSFNNFSSKSYNSRNSSARFGRNRSGKRRGDGPFVDPQIYVKSATKIETTLESTEIKPKFESYNLHDKLKKAIQDRGYIHSTPIQDQVIPHALEKKDIVGLAETGSGKTAGYLIPMLHHLLENNKKEKALIIVPTRELAFQVEKELYAFEQKKMGIFALVCVGGMPMDRQIRMLRKPNQFIIGTPGRLIDLAERGYLDLTTFNSVVVDEMDRMLDMGFIDDITWILDQLPTQKQSLFFSATTNKNIAPILGKFAPDAVHISVKQPAPSANVDQDVVIIKRGQSKLEKLLEILNLSTDSKVIVFANTKSETEKIHFHLQDAGFKSQYLHGGKTQSQRLRTLNQYKKDPEAVLVATDVAARGLDVKDITLVVNYDEPKIFEEYIHRIGRTGRAGKTGKAITIVQR